MKESVGILVVKLIRRQDVRKLHINRNDEENIFLLCAQEMVSERKLGV